MLPTLIPLLPWLLLDRVPKTVRPPAPLKFPAAPKTVKVLPVFTVSRAPLPIVPAPVMLRLLLVLRVRAAPLAAVKIKVPVVSVAAAEEVNTMALLLVPPMVSELSVRVGTLVIVPVLVGSITTMSLAMGTAPPLQLAGVFQAPPPESAQVRKVAKQSVPAPDKTNRKIYIESVLFKVQILIMISF